MFTYLGLNPEITTTLAQLIYAQVRAVMVLALCKYRYEVLLQHQRLTPGEQYRQHIKTEGGFRC